MPLQLPYIILWFYIKINGFYKVFFIHCLIVELPFHFLCDMHMYLNPEKHATCTEHWHPDNLCIPWNYAINDLHEVGSFQCNMASCMGLKLSQSSSIHQLHNNLNESKIHKNCNDSHIIFLCFEIIHFFKNTVHFTQISSKNRLFSKALSCILFRFPFVCH